MSAKFQNFFQKHATIFAFAILVFVVVVTFLSPQGTLTGNSIAAIEPSLQTIALEDGADADVVIAAAGFARSHSITETMLTSELTGTEEYTLIVKNIGGDAATITKSGSNLILEGAIDQGFSALSNSNNYDTFLAYDVVQVVDGSVVGVTVASADEVSLDQVSTGNNCYDSDGDDPYTYGTLSGTDVWGNVIDQTDQCGSGTATVNDVFEKICTDTSYTYTQHTCEYGCFDGACMSPISSEPACGNGVVDEGESCDDGNVEAGDGCTAACSIELKEGCWETDTGVAGTYTGYYYDYYGYGGYESQQEYSYDFAYDNYCYYDSYGGTYYYADYYCYQSEYDNKWYPTSTWNQCSSGCDNSQGCVETATVTPSCIDTDNGKDEKTYGETTLINKFGEERTAADTCYSWTDDYQYVVENSCYSWGNNYYLYTDYIFCDGVCNDGVCVEAAYTPTCEDSDDTALYEYDWQESASTLGKVTGSDKSGNSIEKEDYCYDSYGYEYVVEQYCNDKNARYESYIFCPGGCENGACVAPTWEQSCTDNDATSSNAGRDIYTTGTASGIDYYGKEFAYTDYCYYSSWDGKYYVIDYYCAESSYSGVYASSYWESCPEGCEAGACIGTTTVTPTCSLADKSVSGTDAYGTAYTYYDYCNGAEILVEYSCAADGTAVAAETPCNCVDSQCHTASMTVAQFVETVTPVIVIGSGAATEDNIAAIDLAGAYGWDVVTDATISDPTTGTYVAIGGPYANKVSEAAFGGQVWDYGAGEALFLVKEHDAGGKTLVISGSEAIDTRNAVALLIDNPSSLADVYVVQRVS